MTILITLLFFGAAVVIGIFAVVFGGTLFLSLPLFQVLFPELALASMIGSIKFGSIWRNAAAVFQRRAEIDLSVLRLLTPLLVGSIAGAIAVTEMTRVVVPAVLAVGFLLSEYSKRIRLSERFFFLGSLLIGFYGGIFGAGILLLIIALLQVRMTSIVYARTNALMLEMLLGVGAVGVFIYGGFIDWSIALWWTAGGVVGGYLGGIIIGRTGKLSPATQQWLVRGAFLLALTIATLQLL